MMALVTLNKIIFICAKNLKSKTKKIITSPRAQLIKTKDDDEKEQDQ